VRTGILGGTFDPIHCGHIEAAVTARAALALDRVLVIPSRIPPHRPAQPIASPFHRFAMVALAIDGVDGLAASDIELRAPGPSYTANTLERLHRNGLSAMQIFFIIGADAFAEIATWRRYPDVLDLAHFAVVARPHYRLADLREDLPHIARRMKPARAAAGSHTEPSIFLVDAATPDVSSTDVRERLQRDEPLTGLVPAAVERHILQHGLYGTSHAVRRARGAADQLHGQNGEAAKQ
jgi:nicotinate-nucleotide adenylyltransferase